MEKARKVTSRRREDPIPATQPGHRLAARTQARNPKSAAIEPGARRREDAGSRRSEAPGRSEATTLPPPATERRSGMRSKRTSVSPSATVDEVVADLSKDPRREDD